MGYKEDVHNKDIEDRVHDVRQSLSDSLLEGSEGRLSVDEAWGWAGLILAVAGVAALAAAIA